MFNFKNKNSKRGIVWVIVGLLIICMVVPLMTGILSLF